MLGRECVCGITAGPVDQDRVANIALEANMNETEKEAMVAGLTFILRSAFRHNVNTQDLSNELQQVGLPPEHTTQLCKIFETQKDSVLAHLKKTSLKLPHVSASGEVRRAAEDQVLPIFCVPYSHIHLEAYPVIRLTPSDGSEERVMAVTPDQLHVLIQDLKSAQRELNKLTQ